MPRDYALTPETDAAAQKAGIASPGWYRTPVDPAAIRALMEKSDRIALRDTALWLGLMVLSASIAIALSPSWWSAPFWLVYWTLYGSASDARWHECGHRTAFKTPWMNEAVYQLACFLLIRSPVVWRASHVRHHTDTIIIGRDPEIVAMRPPDLLRVCLNFFALIETWHSLRRWTYHLRGKILPDEAMYLRDEDRPKVARIARIWLVIYVATIGLALWMGSVLPLLVIGLPGIFGAWHRNMTAILQHLGLAENVTDHRLNTRTVLLNPVSRFIYLNMNYHLEHHMFTMVPYYNLPKLHALIQHDTPAPAPSLLAAYRQLLPVLRKQLRYEEAVIVPALPETATPYRAEVDRLRPHAV